MYNHPYTITTTRIRDAWGVGGTGADVRDHWLPGHLQPAHCALHREAAAEAPRVQGSPPTCHT